MIDTLAVDATPGEMRVALISNGRPVEVLYRRTGRESRIGSVFLGRVTRVAPGLAAAFVDIGAPAAGFLNADDARPDPGRPTGVIGDYVHEGAAVIAQVTRDAVADKGPRLTLRLALPGRFLVLAPGQPATRLSRRIDDAGEAERLVRLAERLARPGDGFILRTAATHTDEAAIAEDARALYALWDEIQARARAAAPPACLYDDSDPVARALRDRAGGAPGRVVAEGAQALAAARAACARFAPEIAPEAAGHDGPLFESLGVEDAIEAALSPRVPLPSGGGLAIEETEALVAIDVNMGAGGGASGATAALRTNLEAAAEIGPALRLRNLGGLVVIDFARMRPLDHRRRVLAALAAALAPDSAAGRAYGFSRLGLVELTRRRIGPALADLLCEPCPTCAGAGRIKNAETVANEAARALLRAAATAPPGRLRLRAAPAVAAFIDDPAGPFAELARSLGRAFDICEEAAFAPTRFEIETA